MSGPMLLFYPRSEGCGSFVVLQTERPLLLARICYTCSWALSCTGVPSPPGAYPDGRGDNECPHPRPLHQRERGDCAESLETELLAGNSVYCEVFIVNRASAEGMPEGL